MRVSPWMDWWCDKFKSQNPKWRVGEALLVHMKGKPSIFTILENLARTCLISLFFLLLCGKSWQGFYYQWTMQVRYPFFSDIGAWQYIEQHRHAYFDKMQVMTLSILYAVCMIGFLLLDVSYLTHRGVDAIMHEICWVKNRSRKLNGKLYLLEVVEVCILEKSRSLISFIYCGLGPCWPWAYPS